MCAQLLETPLLAKIRIVRKNTLWAQAGQWGGVGSQIWAAMSSPLFDVLCKEGFVAPSFAH